jgi:hypothetical protein
MIPIISMPATPQQPAAFAALDAESAEVLATIRGLL